jgi:hypothetical protein
MAERSHLLCAAAEAPGCGNLRRATGKIVITMPQGAGAACPTNLNTKQIVRVARAGHLDARTAAADGGA